MSEVEPQNGQQQQSNGGGGGSAEVPEIELIIKVCAIYELAFTPFL